MPQADVSWSNQFRLVHIFVVVLPRDALQSAVYMLLYLSVLSVCPSVTVVHCVETSGHESTARLIDLFAYWCVRLIRLRVGFRTHLQKSTQFN